MPLNTGSTVVTNNISTKLYFGLSNRIIFLRMLLINTHCSPTPSPFQWWRMERFGACFGSFCKYRRALYLHCFRPFVVRSCLELFCFLSFVSFVLRHLCSGTHRRNPCFVFSANPSLICARLYPAILPDMVKLLRLVDLFKHNFKF